MIDEEKDQTVFVFSTSIALSAFLAQIFLNPEKKESSTMGSLPIRPWSGSPTAKWAGEPY